MKISIRARINHGTERKKKARFGLIPEQAQVPKQDAPSVTIGVEFAVRPFGTGPVRGGDFGHWHPHDGRVGIELGFDLETGRTGRERLHKSLADRTIAGKRVLQRQREELLKDPRQYGVAKGVSTAISIRVPALTRAPFTMSTWSRSTFITISGAAPGS